MKPSSKAMPLEDRVAPAIQHLYNTMPKPPSPDFDGVLYTEQFIRILARFFLSNKVRLDAAFANEAVAYLVDPRPDDVDSFPSMVRTSLKSECDDINVVNILDAVHALVEGDTGESLMDLETERNLRFAHKIVKAVPDDEVLLSDDAKLLRGYLTTMVQFCLDNNMLRFSMPKTNEAACWTFVDSRGTECAMSPYLGMALGSLVCAYPFSSFVPVAVTPNPERAPNLNLNLMLSRKALVEVFSASFCDSNTTVRLNRSHE